MFLSRFIFHHSSSQFKRRFTLVELLAVILIMVLVTSFSISAFRGISPERQLEQTELGFRNFCGTARFFAMEDGEDIAVFFSPSKRELSILHGETVARYKAGEEEEETEESPETEEEEQERTIRLRKKRTELLWHLPEGFTLTGEDGEEFASAENPPETGLEEDDRIELFRFFPDGGAGGKRNFILQYGIRKRVFSISPLTGRFLPESSEEES